MATLVPLRCHHDGCDAAPVVRLQTWGPTFASHLYCAEHGEQAKAIEDRMESWRMHLAMTTVRPKSFRDFLINLT